jgi:hypothetical protein
MTYKKGFFTFIPNVLFFLTTIVCSSCRKDEVPDIIHDIADTIPALTITHTYSDADAVLHYIAQYKSNTPFGMTGTAIAYFTQSPGSSNLVSVGDVSFRDTLLAADTQNRYLFVPSAANPGGIAFYAFAGATWKVTGSANFPAFEIMVHGIPTYGGIRRDSVITRSSTFNMEVVRNLFQDSVIYTIAGQGNTLQHIGPYTDTSYTFPVHEMLTLDTGVAVIKVELFKTTIIDTLGKRLYFVNERIWQDTVNISF